MMSLKTLLALQPERIAGTYAPPLVTLVLAAMHRRFTVNVFWI